MLEWRAEFGGRKSAMDMVKINYTRVWNFQNENYLKHLPLCSHNKCPMPVSSVPCQTLILTTLWSLWCIIWWWSDLLHFSSKSFLILFNQTEVKLNKKILTKILAFVPYSRFLSNTVSPCSTDSERICHLPLVNWWILIWFWSLLSAQLDLSPSNYYGSFIIVRKKDVWCQRNVI